MSFAFIFRSKSEPPFLAFLVAILAFATAPRGVAQQPGLSGIAPARSTNRPAPLADARNLMATGHFEEAERALRAYLATEERSGEARYLLAYALLRQNKPKESLQEYTHAATLLTPSAEDLKNVGQAYVLLNDYVDAGKWLSRAVEMDPRDPEIWYGLGRLRYSEQKYSEAADCFERALVLAPKSVKAENNLGLAYEGLNRTDDAVMAYRQAILWQNAGPPKEISEQPLLNLAIVLLHRGDLTEAQTLLTRAVAIAPQDARIHEQQGQLYMQQGNFTEAEKSLEAAIHLDPLRSNLHFLLGQAFRHLGRPEDAKAEFDRAARLVSAAAKVD